MLSFFSLISVGIFPPISKLIFASNVIILRLLLLHPFSRTNTLSPLLKITSIDSLKFYTPLIFTLDKYVHNPFSYVLY